MIVAIAKCYVFRNITCYNFYTTVNYYSTGPSFCVTFMEPVIKVVVGLGMRLGHFFLLTSNILNLIMLLFCL